MVNEISIGTRPATSDDYPFIINRWLISYQAGGTFVRMVHKDVLMRNHHALVEALLSRPTARATVAHDPEVPDLLYGFLVTEVGRLDKPVIHYVYVGKPWRRLGVASTLIALSGISPDDSYFSHYTQTQFHTKPGALFGRVRQAGAEAMLRAWAQRKGHADYRELVLEKAMFNPYAL